MGLIRDRPSLYGAICWSPELGRSITETGDYLERMIANRIVAVRLFPKKLNFSLKKWQVGDLLSVMESRGLPLLLWHTETNWDTIQSICEEYPGLTVIVEGNDQKLLYHNRAFVPLLERHANLYIETHSLIQHEGLEYIVNERGADRLLFGTYYPSNDPNSSMMMVTDAFIPEETKLAIAGGHLRRLIANIH
ncbi:hypothetical protein H7C19_01525 [Cohnella nanjingensis]|uniref:Amidohydrolase-related domain-containing protein n=1 Tax=Cohnella nanjingensis TaxID=1387779 RepID=A0A7X0RKT7_9BACL|nr:hypothetical protein [Cohnella nanjingensis]